MTPEEQYVYDLYTSVLGRAPDPQGFANNLAALQSGQVDAATLAADFANSQEAQTNNIPAAQEQAAAQQTSQSAPSGASSAPSNDPNAQAQATIAQIYQQVLGRAPDAGDTGWVQALASGVDPSTVAQEIANSAEGKAYAASSPTNAMVQHAGINSIASGQPNNTSLVLQGATLVKEGIVSDNDGNAQPAVYQLPNGSQISVDPSSGAVMSATPPTSTYTDPANQRPGYRNIPYAFSTMRDQSTININGVDVPLKAPELVINPNTHQPVTQNGDFVTIQSVSPPPSGGSDFALPLTMMMLAPFTGGASLALGEAVLGAGATGAATLGTAITSATLNAAMAAINGGNVAQAAIKGAIGGAVGVNSMDVAANIVGGGDVINGAATINEVASALNMTNAQVANMISNTVSTTLNAAATGKLNGSIVSAIGNNLAATVIGNYATKLVGNMTDGQLTNAAKAVGAVSQIASSAALNGKDINTAITNNLPQIIGNYTTSTAKDLVKSATSDTSNSTPATATDSFTKAALSLGYSPDQINKFIQEQQSAPSTSGGVQLASGPATSDVSPTSTDTALKLATDSQGSVSVSQAPQIPTDSKGNIYAQQADGTYNIMDPNNNVIGTADTLPNDIVSPNPTTPDTTFTALDSLFKSFNTTPTGGLASTNNVPTTAPSGGLPSTGNVPTTAPSGGLTPGTSGSTGTSGGTAGSGAGGTGTGTGSGTGGSGSGSGTGAGIGGSLGVLIGALSGSGSGGTGGTSTSTSGTGGYTPGDTTTATNPGLTNLVGSTTRGREISLIGEPTTQETVSPMQNQFVPQSVPAYATGGSTSTDLTAGTYNPIGATAEVITPLSGSITAAQYAKLLGIPTISEASNPLTATQYSPSPIQSVQETVSPIHLAEGGLPSPTYNYNQTGFPRMQASFTRGKPAGLEGMPGKGYISDMSGRILGIPGHAAGGEIEGHNPEFFSEGGAHHFVQGGGTGTSDSVPAMLANGEFVIPADVVSGLGDGSNDSGAKVLDEFLKVIRAHKQSHSPKKLPPDSKGPLGYLLQAQKKVKA